MERQDKMMSEIKEMETKHNGCEERLSTIKAQVLGRKTQNQSYHNDLKEIKDRLTSIEATALEKEVNKLNEGQTQVLAPRVMERSVLTVPKSTQTTLI
ncbi:hypothetical protein Pmani_005966 [Petrolisthes manimaculis]|uniref:Uncharacterized protein n=1 Tax=Petrolisthes manimaculis TaxID=1843537 RepID=A0AAE1QBV0_9EUCA|nr:hypothetical protein Pmani_005966 [Petrolisthes manimaculis]